jgi:phage terminase large subunit-like protein
MMKSLWGKRLMIENDPSSSIQEKLEKIKLLEQKSYLREGLPHLYGWKWYKWAREFFESVNKLNFICAANQISKSSSQIRKVIDWATNQEKWPFLWRTRPLVFWYLYPTKDVGTIEFEKKWVPEFMPRGEFKDDLIYGWKVAYQNKHVHAIHFNSGVSVYFKTYEQDASHLMTGTVHAIWADEELPTDLWDELQLRFAASDGYFSMVFTATLGQEFWRQVIEERGNPTKERLPDAAKWQVTMYDCLEYDDGTRSPWTEERIKRIERQCKSQQEILKRVYGRFIMETGLKYPTYDRTLNRGTSGEVDKSWHIYAGVDIGSGGAYGHPSAIVFVACHPQYSSGRVIKAWRGDGITTTASDVLMKYFEMRGSWHVTRAFYDFAARDFFTIAARMGESFETADKSHEVGEQVLNALFKNQMLSLDINDGEIDKLEIEITTLQRDMDKKRCKDDLADALRYGCSKIPWDWSIINLGSAKPVERTFKGVEGLDMLRREGKLALKDDPAYKEINDEFEEINASYEP